MVSDREFIARILDFRKRGSEARVAEQEAFCAAMAEMEAALGPMASFNAMDTSAFPVSVETVRCQDDASQVPDFGAVVTVVRREGGCQRVCVQARTMEADEFLELSLHPANGAAVWRLDASTRGFNGDDHAGKKDYISAGQALRALKASLLSLAVNVLSKGEMAGIPVLPEGDRACVESVEVEIAKARKAGLALEGRRKLQADEIARTSNAVMAVWDVAAGHLGFLEEIGYSIGTQDMGCGIVVQRSLIGADIHIASGETWSRLRIEALPDDPTVVAFKVEDSAGRKGVRSYVPADDAEALAAEMRQSVLDEIEAAESAYLPTRGADNAPALGM